MANVNLTIEQIRAGLQRGFKLPLANLTFSIPTTGAVWTGYGAADALQPTSDLSYLNATQAANFRAAIAMWDALIAPSITEIAETNGAFGEMRVAFTSFGMTGNTAGYSNGGIISNPYTPFGDIWIKASSDSATRTFTKGENDDWVLLLHEIGHTIGLSHPFGDATPLPAPYDNKLYTVMSYTAIPGSIFTFNTVAIPPSAEYPNGATAIQSRPAAVVASTPMVADIAAIQDLFGADPTTAAGNTVYSFTQGETTIQAIYDAGGIDTIDVSGFTRDTRIDLTPGAYSDLGIWSKADQIAYWQAQFPGFATFIANTMNPNTVYEWKDNLGIALNTIIENAKGGTGKDIITGNTAANLLDGGAGDDVLTGMDGDDQLTAGLGTDTLDGGNGDDQLFMGTGFDATDRLDGGIGTDQVGVRGNLTASLGNVLNTEFLAVLSGTSTRFGGDGTARYTYDLTTTDATVAGTTVYTVQANELVAGENLRFDGAAETGGSFRIYAGKGIDTLIGGSGADGFLFGEGARLTAADRIDGGAGADQLGLRGNYALTFGATTMINVETIVLLSAADAGGGAEGPAYAYSLVLHDATVALDAALTVNAAQLRGGESASVNGAAETNGALTLIGGQGADVFVGGARADTLYGGLGADQLTGGGGSDVFLYRAAAETGPAAGARDRILDFTTGDRIDLAVIDAIAGGADDAFLFIGTAAFGNVAGQLRATQVGGGAEWLVEGDIDGNGVADFAITVVSDHAIAATDFVL